MVLGSSSVAVTSPSEIAPASSKEFLDIQANIVWIHSETAACSCENGKYLFIIEETKAITINFNEKNSLEKTIFLYFTCSLINYHCIIDSCWYLLLLPDKK